MDGDEFLRRMRKGDSGVWDDLMPFLRKVSLGACHNLRVFNQLKEDIVQDVAKNVFTDWQSYKKQSELSSWIYSIARNRCLDEMRKMKVRGDDFSHTYHNDEGTEIDITDVIVDHRHSNMEQRLCIYQIIAELEAQPVARKGSKRIIDVLRWYVENSPNTEELAGFLKTSVSAAKERKSYILKQMRELCRKFCGHKECAFSKMEVH